jgi:hypothetical protein
MTANQPSSSRPSALTRLRARVAERAGATVVFRPGGRFQRPQVQLRRPVNDNRLPLRLALARALAIGVLAALIAYMVL